MRSILRTVRVFIVIIATPIAAAVGVVYYLTPALAGLTDNTAKATVLGAVVTLFGVIFSAAYNEVSSYYKAASASLSEKWKLVFPLVQNHYIPWINVAKVLEGSLLVAKDSNPLTDDAVNLVHFHLMLFYGYRLRFILRAGGLILLSTPGDDNQVDRAYRDLESKLLWAKGDQVQTRLKSSYLQHLFVTKDNPDKPYVFEKFKVDIERRPELMSMHDPLKEWLKKKKEVNAACIALSRFHSLFKDKIDKLYAAW